MYVEQKEQNASAFNYDENKLQQKVGITLSQAPTAALAMVTRRAASLSPSLHSITFTVPPPRPPWVW